MRLNKIMKMYSDWNEEMTTMMMMINNKLRLEEDVADDQSYGLLRRTEGMKSMTKMRLFQVAG